MSLKKQKKGPEYITGSFTFNDQQNFYEISIEGDNSIMKLYDGQSKLRMARKMEIPPCKKIITCDKYLIFFIPNTKIAIIDLTNIGMKTIQSSTCSIHSIAHCVYNEKANLFFLTDQQNQLYYLMHSISNIKIKQLYNCKRNGINFQLSSLWTDTDANIYMQFKNQKRLYKLVFNLQSDKHQQTTITYDVQQVYLKNNWQIQFTKCQQEQQMVPRDSYLSQNMQNNNTHLNLNIKHPQGYLKTIRKCQKYLISSTPNQLLIMDNRTQTLIFIYNKQIYIFQSQNLQSPLFDEQIIKDISNTKKQHLFHINKLGYNKIRITIWVYDQICRQFNEYIRVFDNDANMSQNKQLELSLYIHNNVQYIFNGDSIDSHYIQKVKEYLITFNNNNNSNNNNNNNNSNMDVQMRNQNIYQQVDSSKLAIQLLKDLFKNNPQTTNRLANILIDQHYKAFVQNKSTIFTATSKYLVYINQIIKQIKIQLNQAINNSITYCKQSEYKQYQISLRNIIKFISVIAYTVDNQSILNMDKQGLVFDKNTMSKGTRYHNMLQQCKSVYLCLHSLIQLSKLDQQTIQQNIPFKQWKRRINQIGTLSYNAIYEKVPTLIPHFTHLISKKLFGQITIQKILGYMLNDSHNFMHSAYLYICLFSPLRNQQQQQLQIPYLNHNPFIQFLVFIYNCYESHHDIQISYKLITASLPKMTSLCLTSLNDRHFLKYLMCLSVCSQDYVSCYTIITSGVCFEWAQIGQLRVNNIGINNQWSTSQYLLQEYLLQIQFIIKCSVLCHRVMDAYKFLRKVYTQIWQKRQKHSKVNQHDYQKLLKRLVHYATESERIKQLFKIDNKSEDYKIIIGQLKQKYGNQVSEIQLMMKQLQ